MSGARNWFRLMMVALFLTAVTSSLSAATVRDTFDETWNVAAGGRLELSNENGSVEIRSWDRSEVRVRAEIRLKAGSSRVAEEAMEEFRIRTSREGDRISISSRKPRSGEGFLSWLAGRNVEVDVKYDVMVPARFDVDIETVNGSIEASSLSGIVELDSVNGRIVVERSRGAVSAATVNGSINVELVDVARSGQMNFSTTNGSITLSLPADVRANFDAATTNGKITSDIPLTTDSFSRSRVRGTLNGGGTPISVRTVNGSVRLVSSP